MCEFFERLKTIGTHIDVQIHVGLQTTDREIMASDF